MIKNLLLASALLFGAAGQALSLNDIQGHWNRFGVRCAGSSQVWSVPSGVTIDITGDQLTSRSTYASPHYAETSAQILSVPRGSLLDLQFVNVIEKPYLDHDVQFYDFMDNKMDLPLTFELGQVNGQPTLILGNDLDDGANNGCPGALEFLYSR